MSNESLTEVPSPWAVTRDAAGHEYETRTVRDEAGHLIRTEYRFERGWVPPVIGEDDLA